MKKIFLLLFATIIEGQAFAIIFNSGVLDYNITSDTTVEVYSCYGTNYPYLTSLNIPDKVTYNGIEYVVSAIADEAFYECDKLTSVTIPNSVTSIGAYAFSSCNNLQYNEYDNALYLGNNTNPYFALIEAKSFNISLCEINNNCKVISACAFYDINGLSSITIPSSVEGIGYNAFYKVKNIIYSGEATGRPWGALTINGVIDDNFIFSDSYKTNLTAYVGDDNDVIIPESVTIIGNYAFNNCNHMASVSIPKSATDIGKSAFNGCDNLQFVFIDCVADIREALLCFTKDGIKYHVLNKDSVEIISNTYSDEFAGEIVIQSTITSGNIFTVVSICEDAFNNCINLKSVTIPNTVSYIADNAFSDCQNIESLSFNTDAVGTIFSGRNTLKTITIGDSVTNIANDAFFACNNIETITIGKSVTRIGIKAFGYCAFLKTLTFNTNAVKAYFRDKTSLTTVNIGDAVTEIAEHAFDGCKELVTITIGFSISNIGRDAFKYCDKIDYNVYDNAYYIGNNDNPYVVLMKVKNKGITSCNINDKCNHIYQNAFENCSDLKDLIIPNSIISIGSNAFSSCSNLTTIYIPNSVISINDNAFTNCRKMTSVNIPDSVIEIGANAFKGCDGLKTATIGNSVTSIGNGAFLGCSNLASVTIGYSVKSIGENAFNYCDNLKHIICLGTEPAELAVDPFLKTDTIYVPVKSVDTYKTATYWKRKEILPFGVVSVKSGNEAAGTVHGDSLLLADQTLTLYAIPANGYHFAKWSDNNSDNPRVYSTVSDTSFTAIFEAHTVVTDTAVTATCTATGLTEGSHCSVCGEVIVAQNIIPMTEHTAVVDAAVAATATTDGLTEGSHCSVCGTVLVAQEVIPALGEQGGGNENNPSTTVAESAANAINIYAHGRTIVVENATDEIRVYDAMGRIVGRDVARNVCTIKINNSGVYIVKTGSTVKRVMVN